MGRRSPVIRSLTERGKLSLLPYFSDRVWEGISAKLALSDRELQIIRAVFDDIKESAIAHRLGLSPHTVHTYIQRLYAKLGVRGRTRLLCVIFATFLLMMSEPNNEYPPLCGNLASGKCHFSR